MPIGEPFFEFAAAARTTDLLNFPHRFRRAIDILDDDLLTAFLSLERDATALKANEKSNQK